MRRVTQPKLGAGVRVTQPKLGAGEQVTQPKLGAGARVTQPKLGAGVTKSPNPLSDSVVRPCLIDHMLWERANEILHCLVTPIPK